MIPYMVSFFFFYTLSVVAHSVRFLRHRKFPYILGALPLASLAIFRGNVGTDTATYLSVFELMQLQDASLKVFEPTFEYVVLFFLSFGFSPELIIGILAMITTVLLFWGALKFNDQGVFFLCCVMPIFYLDMTMNGLRYGLAFSIVVLAVHALLKRRDILFIVLSLLASSIQVSAIVIAACFYFLLKQQWKVLGVLFLFVFLIFINFGDYLLLKAAAYESVFVPNATTGLSTLFLSICLLAICYVQLKQERWAIATFFLLIVSSYLLTYFSYAGTRAQSLVLFLIFVWFSSMVSLKNMKIPRRIYIVLMLLGVLGMLLKMRNFSDSVNDLSGSPFVPYHFFWERQ